MEMIFFERLNLKQIEQLEKNKFMFYTKNGGENYYGGYINKFGRGFLTKESYLLLSDINTKEKAYKKKIYLDDKNLKIYAWKTIVNTEETMIEKGKHEDIIHK